MYYKVPIIDGVLDIDYNDMIEGKDISITEAIVYLRPTAIPRSSWLEITHEEYENLFGERIQSFEWSILNDISEIRDTLDLILLKQEGII